MGEKWNLNTPPNTLSEAKLFAEEVICRQIKILKFADPLARYTYAWRDGGKVQNLQVFRNGKPEFYISVAYDKDGNAVDLLEQNEQKQKTKGE